MTLGQNIARLRTQKNLSQGDLADALEVSRQSVSKWETDASIPELDKLLRLAELFGVTLDELVKGESAQPEAARVWRLRRFRFCLRRTRRARERTPPPRLWRGGRRGRSSARSCCASAR